MPVMTAVLPVPAPASTGKTSSSVAIARGLLVRRAPGRPRATPEQPHERGAAGADREGVVVGHSWSGMFGGWTARRRRRRLCAFDLCVTPPLAIRRVRTPSPVWRTRLGSALGFMAPDGKDHYRSGMTKLPRRASYSRVRAVGVAAFAALCMLVAALPSQGLAEEGSDREATATVATTVLEPGWNLAGWLGPTIPAADLFQAIPALEVFYTWDSGRQVYRSHARTSAPQAALLVETGMGLWLYLAGDGPFEWKRPVAPQGVVLSLQKGWNLVAWSGLDGLPATAALSRLDGPLVETMRWDGESGRFERWRPDPTQTRETGEALSDLRLGDALWIKLTDNRDWWVPGSAQPTFEFADVVPEALRAEIRAEVASVIAFFAERFGAFYPAVKVHTAGVGCYAGGDSIWLSHWWCTAHEYFHVLQWQAAGGPARGPRWLLEGAATYMEELHAGDLEWRRQIAPARAARVGSLSNPGMADAVSLNYHLGFLAADWLVQHAGEKALIDFYRQLPAHNGWEEAFAAAFGLPLDEFYDAFALHRAIVAPPLPHAVDDMVRPLVAAEGAVDEAIVARIQAEMDSVSGLLVERFGAQPAEYSIYIGADLNDVADHRDRLWENPWWDYEVRQFTLPLEWDWPCSFGATGWIAKVLDCGRPLGAEDYVHSHMRVLLEGKEQLDPSILWIEAGTGMLAVLASRLGEAAGYATGQAAEPAGCAAAGGGPKGGLRDLESREDWEGGDGEENRADSLAGAIWLARHAGERSLFRYLALLPDDTLVEPSGRGWRDPFEEAFGLTIEDFYARFEACRSPMLGGPVPEVTTLVTGEPGVVVLEWSEGPADATRWQFRLRAAGLKAWSGWSDIPDEDASARRYRVANLPDGSWWAFQVRGVTGTLAGEPSDSAEAEVPAFDANGIPWLHAGWAYEPQLSEGGRAWRLDGTVVDIPPGMRISAWADHPLLNPSPPFDMVTIEDADSGSTLRLSTDFGGECARVIQPSPSGRDVNALFDRIVASARVQIEAAPWLTVAATGERGEVRLRWVGGPWNATHWEYRLRGPYWCQKGSDCDDSQRRDLPWGEWMEIASGTAAGSHLIGGLPDLAAWDFQVRARVGDATGTAQTAFGAPAVVGPDGIPQLHRFYSGEGGGTWRLGESPTVVDVPIGLVVGVSDRYSGGRFLVSDAAGVDGILVDAETASWGESGGRVYSNDPPCGATSERNRALFDQVRASVRLKPIAR